jgi:hypothetical protein
MSGSRRILLLALRKRGLRKLVAIEENLPEAGGKSGRRTEEVGRERWTEERRGHGRSPKKTTLDDIAEAR